MSWLNPILAREVEHRMRDNRTYFIPMVYILVLGLVTLGAYLTMVQMNQTPYTVIQGWVIGKVIFHLIAFTQMTLILLLVPSVSAGAITAERDHATLPMLLVTPMSRWRITSGKLFAPILYVLLLVSTSIPFAALSFGFGGTDLRILGVTYLCLIATTLFVAALGLAVSTIMKRTVPAVLLAYGLIAALLVATGVAEIALHIFFPEFKQIVFVYLNPYTPLFINVIGSAEEIPRFIFWWITPLVQLFMAAACTAVAALRIHFMRD